MIEQHERRLNRTFLSEHAGHRTTFRQAMVDQILGYKAALQDDATWLPFRLN